MDQNLIAVIVGVVEGLTEFLPVSSTGHMIIVGHVLGFQGDLANVFDVFIQLGAILSVLVLYKQKFLHFFTKEGWRVDRGLSAWHVLAGIVPVALIGFLTHKLIKTYLFSPFTVAIGLLLGSVLMMAAERYIKGREGYLLTDVDKLSLRQAALIGAYQIFALWPGFSRSGSTLAGALFVGVNRKAAADFSFIIAVPLMFMACIYDLLKNMGSLHSGDIAILAIGFVVAFIVAYFSIVWFLKFMHKYTLTSFAYYRIFLAAFTIWYFYL